MKSLTFSAVKMKIKYSSGIPGLKQIVFHTANTTGKCCGEGVIGTKTLTTFFTGFYFKNCNPLRQECTQAWLLQFEEDTRSKS